MLYSILKLSKQGSCAQKSIRIRKPCFLIQRIKETKVILQKKKEKKKLKKRQFRKREPENSCSKIFQSILKKYWIYLRNCGPNKI